MIANAVVPGQPSKEPSSRRRLTSAETRLRPPKAAGRRRRPSSARIVRARSPGLSQRVDRGAQEVDRGLAPARDVERVAPRRLEPEHRPAGDLGARVVARARSRSRRRRSATETSQPRRGCAGGLGRRARARRRRAPPRASARRQQRARGAGGPRPPPRHSKRSRKRTSIRTIAGPAISASATLPTTWATSNGTARALEHEEVLAARGPLRRSPSARSSAERRRAMPAKPQVAARVRRPALRPAAGERRAEDARRGPSPPSATASTGPARTRSWRPARRGRRPRSRARRRARSRRR